MIEAAAKNIYRISVPLPENPLKELNSYFIRGTDRDLLIDTGFRRKECQNALEAGLWELKSDPAKRDVLITHFHADHSGMADLFAGPSRHIYMTQVEMDYDQQRICGDQLSRRKAHCTAEGFPAETLDYIFAVNPAWKLALPAYTNQFRGLHDGDILEAGEYRLKTILVPGHTPGNAIFWAEEQKILFSGDHILFDITPNVTMWEDVEDSLGDYLNSLRKVRNIPVRLTLPGHRETGDFHGRIDALLAHHSRRIQEALQIVTGQPGLTAYEIAGQMTWRIRAQNWDEFPPIQKWFAVGEGLSHLDYLRKRGKVSREMEHGLWRYFKVSV